jgi:hypothetical protein
VGSSGSLRGAVDVVEVTFFARWSKRRRPSSAQTLVGRTGVVVRALAQRQAARRRAGRPVRRGARTCNRPRHRADGLVLEVEPGK